MKEELLKSTIKTLSNTAVEMIRIKGFENAKNDISKLSEVCDLITKQYSLEAKLHNNFALSVLNKMLYNDDYFITWNKS